MAVTGNLTITSPGGSVTTNAADYTVSGGIAYMNLDIVAPTSASTNQAIFKFNNITAVNASGYFNGPINFETAGGTAELVGGVSTGAGNDGFSIRSSENGGFYTYAQISGHRIIASAVTAV